MELDLSLLHHFRDRLIVDPSLTRPLVSFQANKNKVGYRWYKFKEAFSASLIEHLLQRYGANQGRVLDPFAGSGTTLFVASANGLAADGIEVLPIGQKLIAARMLFEAGLDTDDLEVLHRWARTKPWTTGTDRVALRELRITKGAYPAQTVEDIEKYLSAIQTENERVRSLLLFALLSVIESVSYTRKDGQYLRWDYRSGRAQGAKVFDKGTIHDFDTAIRAKIDEIVFDMQNRGKSTDLFPTENQPGEIRLFPGSCLDVLPLLPGSHYDAVITSPPYCNRYDYTRTYALELALLGVGEHELIQLRQQMLSCTVENRAKDLLRINPHWAEAIAAADDQPLLQRVLAYLEEQKAQGALNNNGIPRMMRGYFYEMACVIAECVRVMKPGALLIMVNDNVRYAGASVSVDLILSDFAGKLGFGVERILVLPGGKGNSSQQMGEHGREALRKCVYVWRRSKFSIEIIVSDRTAGSNPKP
ncbi:MAG: DNA methyltransferase [Blastocatellia bacterium]